MSAARRTITAENWIGWVGRWLAVWIAVGFLPLAAAETGRPAVEHYTYLETTGSRVIPIEYTIERSEQVVIKVARADEHFFNRCETSGATVEWSYRGDNGEVRAQRDGRILVVQGHRQGKPFQKRHPIDEAPWLQPLSYALQLFVQSDRQVLRFWLIRTDNLEPIKLKAMRSGTEMIFVDGRNYSSRRIDVSPSGPFSFVWQGSYWFRKSDAVFLQYAGGHLLSGPADTLIRIRTEANP